MPADGITLMQTKLLVFGGDTMTYSRPNFVPKEKWHLNSDYMSSQAGAEAVRAWPAFERLAIVVALMWHLCVATHSTRRHMHTCLVVWTRAHALHAGHNVATYVVHHMSRADHG